MYIITSDNTITNYFIVDLNYLKLVFLESVKLDVFGQFINA